jgi:CxxC-x17-CxxC domain-containing protein
MTTTTAQRLICDDCGAEFLFTLADQAVYARYPSFPPPRRCPACLETRLAERAADRRRTTAAPAGHGRARRAVACQGCGQATLISYAPRHGRPVFCQACFLRGRRGPSRWPADEPLALGAVPGSPGSARPDQAPFARRALPAAHGAALGPVV